MLYFKTNGVAVPWDGDLIDDIRHPQNIEILWSDAQLATIGLYRPKPGAATPPGQQIVSSEVGVVDGVVRWVHTFADLPPPSPNSYRLTMRQLRGGLVDHGFGANFIANVIAAMPEGQARERALVWSEETVDGIEWAHPITQALISAAATANPSFTLELAAEMWIEAAGGGEW